MQIIDFSNCKHSIKNGFYGGLAGRKEGIIYNNENWLIKYPKSTKDMINVPISYTTSPLNEYVGSHIYEILGYDVHKTCLGIRQNKLVVACKDFEINDYKLFEIRTLKNYANEELGEKLDRFFNGTGSKHFVNFNELYLHIKNNEILTSIPGIEERFWDMFIVDALNGNFDRHGGNWGFIKKDNKYRIAPVYDNGSSMYPKLNTDEAIKNVLSSEEEIYQRIYKYPTSHIKINGRKSSYYEVINSLKFEECNKALKRIVPKIDFAKIYKLIDSIEGITDIRKEFYKTMYLKRYEKILKTAFDRLKE